MSRNRNVLPVKKLQAIAEYLNGEGSQETIAKKYGVNTSSFQRWLRKYEMSGNKAFIKPNHSTSYSSAFKQQVVNAYLTGEGSLRELATKYKISSDSTVFEWIKKYNSHGNLKTSKTGGIYIMTKGRNTR